MKTLQFSKVALVLSAAFLFTFPLSSSAQVNDVFKPGPAIQDKILQGYGKLPLSFEANQGQTDARVKFLSRGSGYTLFLTSGEAVLALQQTSAQKKDFSTAKAPAPLANKSAVLHMKLLGANPVSAVSGLDEMPGKSNYFIGSDPTKWRSNVPTYSKVKYEEIYSGIDLVYYGNQQELEYDFVVAPGADPSRIQFDVRGAKRIRRDENGDLVLKMGDGEIRWHKPVVYQEKNGTRQEIAARYAITDTNWVRFKVAKYDASRPLYIDPLIYSTYLGGSNDDRGYGIAVDSAGNAYVTGWTASRDFPTMNPLQPTHDGEGYDAFVTKLNSTGSALVYSTYLGGSGFDQGLGIAVDSSGNAYVTGITDSTDFPTMNPLQPVNGGSNDAFVSKLNPTGSALVYSTYLGGSGAEQGYGIAVDGSGNAYVTGWTSSTDFPTMNPLQPALDGGGSFDAYVAKINPTGSAFVYSTYLGGSGSDYGQGVAVDSSGNAYVIGYTSSTDFPTMNPLQPTYSGGQYDAFVSKLNSTGSALVYSTYLGGSGVDYGYGIAVDSAGGAYVTGYTESTNLPTLNPLQPANGGNGDAFVAKLNASGSALVYSTYLGGSQYDWGVGIAVDSAGGAYVTGFTVSTNFPTVNPLQPALAVGGSADAFVSTLNPSGSALVYSTYLGGMMDDRGYGIAVDSAGNAYVAGWTASKSFPTMNPLQPTHANDPGGYDAFVAKIASIGSDKTPPITTANPSPGPNSSGWNNTNVTVNLTATDNSGGSGVKQIQLALGGAQNTGWQTVAGNAASVTISTEGITILSYFATDNAGNQETAKTLTVRIDKTPPLIFGLPAPGCTIWPPNHKLVQVATVTAADAVSGLAPGSFKVTGTSNDPANGQIVISSGQNHFNVQLGADKGQIYTLTATVSDLAGNVATSTGTCTVPHDQGT